MIDSFLQKYFPILLTFIISFSFKKSNTETLYQYRIFHWCSAMSIEFDRCICICWQVENWSLFFSFFISQNVNANTYKAHFNCIHTYKKNKTLIWTIQPKTILICTSKSKHWVIWNILCIVHFVHFLNLCKFHSGTKWMHCIPFSATRSAKCKICHSKYEMYYKLFCHLVWYLMFDMQWVMTHDSRSAFQMLILLMDFPKNMPYVSIN